MIVTFSFIWQTPNGTLRIYFSTCKYKRIEKTAQDTV